MWFLRLTNELIKQYQMINRSLINVNAYICHAIKLNVFLIEITQWLQIYLVMYFLMLTNVIKPQFTYKLMLIFIFTNCKNIRLQALHKLFLLIYPLTGL